MNYKNIKMLANKMYKSTNGSFPDIMNAIFQLREDNHYNPLQIYQFIVPHANKVFNGSESVYYMGPMI